MSWHSSCMRWEPAVLKPDAVRGRLPRTITGMEGAMKKVHATVAAVALALWLAPATLAAGAPVVIGPQHDEGETFITDCGAFDIIDHYSVDYTLRLFFDRAGELVQGVESVQGTDTFTNSHTGASITGRFANSVLIDFTTGFGANSGVVWKMIVPGWGPVLMEIGRVVSNEDGSIVTFQKGQQQFTDGDFAAVCAALS